MIMKEGWDNFKKELSMADSNIVCFGAGTIPLLVEPFFEREGIWNKIYCFIDSDNKKVGKGIGDGRKISVMSMEEFKKEQISKFVLLVMVEAYVPVVEYLNNIEEWKEISCYLYAKMNYEIVSKKVQMMCINHRNEMKIPKIIHYCWFGGNAKSELHKRCISSWREKCWDYQIIEWNEKNYDVNKSKYMSEAYERRKWAYVSDYARLDILYSMGGIYLDTDVELLKSMDLLLGERAFVAYGQWPAVNSGAGIGCVKNHPLIGEMRDNPRAYSSFYHVDGTINFSQNGYYESRVLRKYGFKQDFTMEYVNDLLVLAPEYMASASVLGADLFVTKNTLSIHHCDGSWASLETMYDRKKTAYRCGGIE